MSDDGDVLFVRGGSASEAVALPSLTRLGYDHPSSYFVRLLGKPTRSTVVTEGQADIVASGRPNALPVTNLYGGLMAARSRFAWIDARVIMLHRSPANKECIVLSSILASETRDGTNLSGLAPVSGGLLPISAAYGQHGIAVAAFCRNKGQLGHSWRSEVVLYALTGSGKASPWHRSSWHTFNSTIEKEGQRTYVFDIHSLIAVDLHSGRSAAPNGHSIDEWDPSAHRVISRALPSGAATAQLCFVGGKLMLSTVDAKLFDTAFARAGTDGTLKAADDSRRLFVAHGTGWTDLGNSVIKAWSENGRFVLLRNLADHSLWLYDSRKH